MNLIDYPTPLTDAIHEGRRDRYLGGTVPFEFAADLERKLALCREALQKIQRIQRQLSTNTTFQTWNIAKDALTATEPKP